MSQVRVWLAVFSSPVLIAIPESIRSIFTTVGERLRHLIKVSAATALKDLKSLVDLGLQEWVGPSKKTWYVLREMRT
jgi:vacuolar-type H+-ATPase subunit E/Vma4